MKIIKHIIIVIVVVIIVLGIPALLYVDIPALFAVSKADAVSSASMELPDVPSGKFIILINNDKHRETYEDWNIFFEGEDAGVIMEDIDCMCVASDLNAKDLADRYKLRLAQNQMETEEENGLMLSSKAESGFFDVIIISEEYYDVYRLDTIASKENVSVIEVKGS